MALMLSEFLDWLPSLLMIGLILWCVCLLRDPEL